MKIIYQLSLTLLLALAVQKVSSQERKTCGTDEAEKIVFEKHPELLLQHLQREEDFAKIDRREALSNYASQRLQSVVYIIPVVFHIIHQNGAENITDAKVREAIRVMNEDFRKLNPDSGATIALFKPIMADCEIEFQLAELDPNGNCTNGIDRVYSWETNNGGESAKFNQWPQNQYLNIWVVKSMSAAHATAAAYSYTPGNAPPGGDGIISLFNYVGTNPGNSHTLSHEVGHWLNLRHTWGSGNQPNVTCGTDNVSDTPTTKGSPSSCNVNLSICSPPVIENVQNFMDYSFCTTMFTLGQKARMRAALTSTTAGRSNMWTSANLALTGTGGASTLCAADFISNNFNGITCENGLVSYSDVSYNGQVNSRTWTCPGAVLSGASTFNDSVVTVQYPTAGVYDVSLTASNGASTVSVTKQQVLTVLPGVAAYSNATYTESFETSALPNSDWEVKSPDNGNINWAQFSAAGSSGTASAFIENYSADSADVDELIGPTINIQAISNPVFTFKIAFKRKTSADNDALKIWTSTDCGKNWSLRKTITGAALASVATPSAQYFIPASNEWRQETVSIANLLNSTNARIKFQLISGGGNNLFIDDINIIGNTGLNEVSSGSLNLSLFPNPSSENSMLSFTLTAKSKVSITLTDVIGQVVETMSPGELGMGNHQIEMNRNGKYAPGVYLVNVLVNGQRFNKKLVINK